MRPFIEKLSGTKCPFYAETLSGGRDLSTIKTEKKLLELFNSGAFDSIIRIGHTPLSKIWRLLERKTLPVFHFDSRSLPALSYGELHPFGAKDLLYRESFWEILGSLEPRNIHDNSECDLTQLIERYPNSEIAYFRKIQEKLSQDDIVYLGNSLVIRFFELTQNKRLNVFGNRGVNGIDGQLATAIGLAMGRESKVYTILGDVTTFYDLSSLRDIPKNLHLIIINNKGGRIFDLLNLDKRIVLEHENDFEMIAKGFGLTYATSFDQFGEVQVLELSPQREESQKFLKEWLS
jgi:2-succinyl-5-enolpyruvyl-6-hydroxy-3-cyclohexene-1-carboxylate synthase